MLNRTPYPPDVTSGGIGARANTYSSHSGLIYFNKRFACFNRATAIIFQKLAHFNRAAAIINFNKAGGLKNIKNKGVKKLRVNNVTPRCYVGANVKKKKL